MTTLPTSAAASGRPVPWRRRPVSSSTRRALVGAVVLGIYVPVSKAMGKRWPRAVARLMNRYLAHLHEPYVPAASDVVVASYFKSGTNWTMQIAVQIAYRGRAEFEHIHDLVPWPDIPSRTRYALPVDDDAPRQDCPTGLRVVKTHLPLAGELPYVPAARYIAVVRDPKDVFVSGYHFCRSMFLGRLMPSVADWLDVYLSPDTPIGSWAEHVASYWRERAKPNVLFLTYEQMRGDLPGTVDRIATFMGVQLNEDERAAVIERSTFQYMKNIGHKFEPPGPPWAKSKGAMMRRGERGASHELLTREQQQRIDDYWRAELAALGCDFAYDEAFGAISG